MTVSMIVTVVKNDQLKSPRANAANKDILLVLPTGKVLRPLKLATLNSFCKEYLVAFDIPIEHLVQKRINFSGLEKAILERFPKRLLGRILELLSLSQSLSIVHVAKNLEIERDSALVLVELFVKWGAYSKYNHYWRRTPDFAVWSKKRVEG